MEQQVTITKPETFLVWLDFVRPDLELSEKDAELILRYMEGHDYQLILKNGELCRKDVAEEQGEMVPYGMDDVIDLICEWNYELKQCAREGMEHPRDFVEYCNYKESYDALQEDSEYLDTMFEKTIYGKQNKELVENIVAKALGEQAVMQTMEEMQRKECQVAEPEMAYEPEERGR